MELNIKDRLLLGNLLPQKGNFTEMIILDDIKSKIKITVKDIEEYQIKSTDSNITWNEKGFEGINFDFSTSEKEILYSLFKELDDKKEITPDNFELCKKLKDLK